MSRISSPSSVPPGSRVNTTSRPWPSSHSFSKADWVDLPDPSPPSNVTKRPATSESGFLGCCSLRSGPLRRALRLWFRGALRSLVGEQLHGTLEVDVVDLLAARDRGIRRAIGDVRAEATILDPDRLAAFRVRLELLERTGCRSTAVLR